MTVEVVAGPSSMPTEWRQVCAFRSLNTHFASWVRAFFSHPSPVAALFWTVGAVAVASVLPLRHWAPSALAGLLVVAAIAITVAGLRLTVGSRLPRWSLQVDVGLGNLLVSVVCAVTASDHLDLANLYLLVTFFAVLYLTPRAALAHIAAAGVAYAAVLGVGPRLAEPPAVAWPAVFVPAVVLGSVVLGLVSVLRVAAREDPLTGLANRRSWDERLEEEMARSARSGRPLTVVILDLDGFKAVNDAGGHDAGDRLLQSLARAWQAKIRGGGDLLARLGGDEFGLLAPGSDAISVSGLAKRLAESLPEEVSVSIGIATWDGTENASDLLRRADQAMYHKKKKRTGTRGNDQAGPTNGRLT